MIANTKQTERYENIIHLLFSVALPIATIMLVKEYLIDNFNPMLLLTFGATSYRLVGLK